MYTVKITAVCNFKKQPSKMRLFSQLLTMPGYSLKLRVLQLNYSHSSSLVTGALPPHWGHQRSSSIISSVSHEYPHFLHVCTLFTGGGPYMHAKSSSIKAAFPIGAPQYRQYLSPSIYVSLQFAHTFILFSLLFLSLRRSCGNASVSCGRFENQSDCESAQRLHYALPESLSAALVRGFAK